jgi:hypothetical protein
MYRQRSKALQQLLIHNESILAQGRARGKLILVAKRTIGS